MMISALLNKLGLGDGSFNTTPDARRKYIRFDGTCAQAEVNGQAFRVKDWSAGGISFDAAPGSVKAGDSFDVVVRFSFAHETVSMRQQARVVRSANRGVAAQFAPMTADDRRMFDRIVDSYHAQSFFQSQVA